MKGQIALDILVAFAISGAFAILIASMAYGTSSGGGAQLATLSNAAAHASAVLNYSTNPVQEFGIQSG